MALLGAVKPTYLNGGRRGQHKVAPWPPSINFAVQPLHDFDARCG